MTACSQGVISSQGIDFQERFASFLTPIRDLSRNWNVNIADGLEFYLARLVSHAASQNGAALLNFSQAALLIQGSTCVYSKKVEYLHGLVLRAVEELFTKKRKETRLPSSIAENGKDTDATFDNHEHDKFLSLDDLDESDLLDINNNNRRRSAPRTTPRRFDYIVPFEEGNAPSDEAAGGDAANNGDFLMNTSGVDERSGTWLLTPGNRQLLCNEGGRLAPNAFHNSLRVEPHSVDDDVHDPPMDDYLPNDDFSDVDEDAPPPQPPLPRLRLENPHVKSPARQPEISRLDRVKTLDPYEPDTEKPLRKLRKRVSIKMPSSLSTQRGRKRKADNTIVAMKKEPASPISAFCPFKYFSKQPFFPKNASAVPKCSILEDLYWNEQKRRKELLRSRQKLFRGEEQQALQEEHEVDDGFPVDNDDLMPEGGDISHGGFALDVSRQERGIAAVDPIERIDDPIPSSYEDLVLNYVKDKEKFCQLTDMGKRVNDWAEKIKPKLAEKELQETFDIHLYGTHILNCYNNSNRKQTLAFSEIVHGLDRCEVSRFFLASLQLANTENVQISTSGVLEEGMDTMELTLLSRKRHHEELNDYRAPSHALA